MPMINSLETGTKKKTSFVVVISISAALKSVILVRGLIRLLTVAAFKMFKRIGSPAVLKSCTHYFLKRHALIE